jgi:lipopolysaccharide biosynthesis glycosyltransferase
MKKVFIGYEKAEEVAYHTLASSIMQHASRPVAIIPVDLRHLGHVYHRKHDPKQSNSFTYSRFLVPYLSDYIGTSLFMDCDMLVRDDIHKLFKLADMSYDVQCVQHPEYTSKLDVKYLGNKQYNYPRKNWSSMMLFNNPRCRILTPDYVNNATPADLHRMTWARSIGDLPKEWNHLVGEFPENPNAKIAHFTLGTPCWPQFADCEYADEWAAQRDEMMYVAPELEASA